MSELRTIILAAGKGTRMKSETPKVLHRVGGKALIDYVVHIARAVGSLKICVVLGHKTEMVQEHLQGFGRTIATVEQKKLLGTADAVKCAAGQFRHSGGDVLILCGDTPLLRKETVRQLIQKHRRSNAACTFLTAVVPDAYGYGRIIRDEEGRAIAMREENDASPAEKQIREINVGVYCFKTKILFDFLKKIKMNSKKREFYLTDIIGLLAQAGQKIETLETPDAQEGWGVNTREDLAKSNALIGQRILKDLMMAGVTIVDPQTTHIDADVKIGADTIIRPFTVIEDNVRIGRRCKIGPFCHIRPGTRLADDVEIGNFGEVSRSHIGPHSLMKHFGFLGDARIGAKVNVGAGVVTANYDGVNKNKTFVGDQAFIGSDSILVAPVKIGKRALTGAGCVVAPGKNVPEGRIVVGVPGRLVPGKKR